MNHFKFTIFNQKRIILGITMLPFFFFVSIIIGKEIGSYFYVFILTLLFIFSIIYFAIGNLSISIEKNELTFKWNHKLLFNFKKISPLKIEDIEILVIDNDAIIRKIIANSTTININNFNSKQNYTQKFIINLIKKNKNIKIIDSWDVWKNKGYLKTAYWINNLLLYTNLILLIIVILNPNDSEYYYFPLYLIPIQVMYSLKMKKKLQKTDEK